MDILLKEIRRKDEVAANKLEGKWQFFENIYCQSK